MAQFLLESVFDENAALRGAEVRSLHLDFLVVKWFVDYSSSWSFVNGQPNHAGDVV